jgi:hypothetical protein
MELRSGAISDEPGTCGEVFTVETDERQPRQDLTGSVPDLYARESKIRQFSWASLPIAACFAASEQTGNAPRHVRTSGLRFASSEMSVIHMADLADVSGSDCLTAFERHVADLIQTPAALDAMELPRDTAQVTP